MKTPREKQLELLGRRVELLHTLLRLNADWLRAFVALDMNASENLSSDEQLAAAEIKSIDKQLALADGRHAGPEIRALLNQVALLHAELSRSNQTRKAMLRRVRLSIGALRNLFNSYAPAYTAPAAGATGAICRESV